MKKLLFFILLPILIAPAPWGIALNHSTKECAGYWAGDEYISYHLPPDWEMYYPDSNNMITTEVGSCQWSDLDYETRTEKCCQQLGYSFVSGNIGEKQSFTIFSILVISATIAVCLFVLLIFSGLVFLIVRLSARRAISSDSTGGASQ
jgi:hypothetical protein